MREVIYWPVPCEDAVVTCEDAVVTCIDISVTCMGTAVTCMDAKNTLKKDRFTAVFFCFLIYMSRRRCDRKNQSVYLFDKKAQKVAVFREKC